jgi:hypothetical protein
MNKVHLLIKIIWESFQEKIKTSTTLTLNKGESFLKKNENPPSRP